MILDKKDTLVVAIDLQYGYLSPNGDASKLLGWDNSNTAQYISNVNDFLNKIRKYNVDTCFFQMEEVKETLAPNLSKEYKDDFTELCKRGTKQYELVVDTLSHEQIFHKTHYSGFHNDEFRKYAKNYKNIIFIGTLASRCVYGTMVSMSSFKYNCYYVEDLCSNPSNLAEEKKHFVNVANLFSTVVSSSKILKYIA